MTGVAVRVVALRCTHALIFEAEWAPAAGAVLWCWRCDAYVEAVGGIPVEERRRRVAELRGQGLTWPEIGAVVAISREQARKDHRFAG